MAGLNIGNKPEKDNYKAYLLGLSFDLSNSLFDYLQLGVSSFKDDSISNKYGLQITPVWGFSFKLAELKSNLEALPILVSVAPMPQASLQFFLNRSCC